MRTLLTVFIKEFLENLRDRRTLLSALLFGPLFGPLLFGLMVSRMLEQSLVESDVPLKIMISGGHHAHFVVEAPDHSRRRHLLLDDVALNGLARLVEDAAVTTRPAQLQVLGMRPDERTRRP